MKYSDKLFELAFEFKKRRVWTRLRETEVFALKMRDGQIGYISVMGMGGEHFAVSLYLGDEGINSLLHMMNVDVDELSYFEYYEHMTLQNCLQCSFENKGDIAPEYAEQAQEYADAHGIKPTKKNGYPCFMKYMPHHVPWDLQTKKEEKQLCEALSAVIAADDLIRKHKRITGLESLYDAPEYMPLFEEKDGQYELRLIKPQVYRKPVYPEPRLTNDIIKARIIRMRKSGTWQCDLVYLTEPVHERDDDVPEFPAMVFIVDEKTGNVYPMDLCMRYETEPEKLLNMFASVIVNEGVCPRKIKVGDERTYRLLQGMCSQTGIKLVIEDELPELLELEEAFARRGPAMDRMDVINDLYNELVEAIQNGEDPKTILRIFEEVEKEGIPINEDLKNIIKALSDIRELFRKKRKKKQGRDDRSVVISVSFGKGCYRHIRVPVSFTLEKFSSAILDAFEFDDDHAHEFFMDNRWWSSYDSYVMRGAENDGEPTTDQYRLRDFDLEKGQQFKYIFDFGDEWRFQCKVLRLEEGNNKKAEVIRSVGDAPEQYGGE